METDNPKPPTPAVRCDDLLGAIAVLAAKTLHGKNYSDLDGNERALGRALGDAGFGRFSDSSGYFRYAPNIKDHL